MEKFEKGEIVLYKNYMEEPDWQFGIYLGYEKDTKDNKPYTVNPYYTEFNDNTCSIDKYPFHFRNIFYFPLALADEVQYNTKSYAHRIVNIMLSAEGSHA